MKMLVKSLAAVLLLLIYSKAQENEVKRYVKLITEAMKNASTYEHPVDAGEYFARGKRTRYGSYDFVVVGSGSAGSVVANRLSAVTKWEILLLEAGPYGNNVTDVPNLYSAVDLSHYNWGFRTTPQETACLGMKERSCSCSRGRGVGGTTLINGLVYSRGHKSDFDKLEKLVGDKRWGYDNVLRLFKKSENFVHNDPDAPYEPGFHGTGGYFRVEYHKPKSPQLDAFLEANQELGYDLVDYNANKLGVSQSQVNTINGRRLDSAKAFLEPIRHRKNLEILPDSYVTKVIIKRNRAKGVNFSHGGNKYFVEARNEVILCAGAFGSPHILMLSGIGPKKHLQDVGIATISDLEVGSSLRDHPMFLGINVDTNYTEPIKPLEDYVKQFLKGEGPYAIPNNNQGVGFYESTYTKGTGVPDFELEFIPANATNELTQKTTYVTDQTYQDLWQNNVVPRSFIIYIVGLHPQSTGTVRLKNKNPYEYPLIDSRQLSDPKNRDIRVLYDGIQLVLKLLKTKAFKGIDAKLQGGPLKVCKQHEYLSKEYWFCALRQLTQNLYHPVASCPIGKVVDSKLRVYGIGGLRVADASVFPLTLACHTNAPAVMVGEQAAELVKEMYRV